MDENLSLVSSAGQILSVKNEEEGQRVKRRRVMRKCHSDGVSVREEIRDDRGSCGIYDL